MILSAAHAANHGQSPISGRDFTHDDFFIPLDDEAAIVDRLMRMLTSTITAQRGIAAADTRGLVPVYKSAYDIDALNKRLRKQLNPAGPQVCKIIYGERLLRTADRLVWLTNTPEHGLVNGEDRLLFGIERTPSGIKVELTTDDG